MLCLHKIRGIITAFIVSQALLSGVLLYAEPLIIDHTAVQKFSQIPDYWLEKAKELSVYYGHTSHGSQIVAGLNYLEAYIDPLKYKYKAAIRFSTPVVLPAQETPPALCMAELGAHTYDYWEGEAALNKTLSILSSNSYDVSGWSWCGEHNNTAMIQPYLNAMQYLENARPDVMFFYMTGHAGGISTLANNSTIRQYCINNNKILFDFEDIEFHDQDGNYHPEEDGTGVWCAEWVNNNPGVYLNIPVRVEIGGGGDDWMLSSHAHGLFTIMKAQAFWVMMARLAGWDGVTAGTAYTLSITTTGNGSVARNPIRYQYEQGTVVTLTAVPDNNYTFGSWSGDLSGSVNPATITMNSDKSITAHFTAVVNQPPAVSNIPDQTVIQGEDFTDIQLDNYVYDPDDQDSEIIWTYSGNVHLSVSIASRVAHILPIDNNWAGTEIIIFTAADPGGLTDSEQVNFTVNARTYLLTLQPSTGGTVVKNPDKASYTAGEHVSLTAIPAQGCVFDRWIGSLTGNENPSSVVMDADKIIQAVFKLESAPPPSGYMLTIVVQGEGAVEKNPDKASYTAGEHVSLTAIPAQGYVFDCWIGSLTGNENPASVVMDNDKIIQAVFKLESAPPPSEYTLTVAVQGEGAVEKSPDKASYTAGEHVSLTAIPAQGCVFDRWIGSITGNANPAAVVMDSDKNIRAVFSLETVYEPEEEALLKNIEFECRNNMFNPEKGESVDIQVVLKKQSRVEITIYDLQNRNIKKIADEDKPGGQHHYKWNGKNDRGRAVGSGIYIVHCTAGGYTETKKIAVIK